MKRVYFLLVAIFSGSIIFAQSQLVATLSHGSDLSMFSGANALVNAVAAAQDGDIINLSGGTFNGTVIDKGLTIQGTGITAEVPTVINSTVTTKGVLKNLTLEGLYFEQDFKSSDTLYSPYFSKCYFKTVTYNSPAPTYVDAIIANCIVRTFYCSSVRGRNLLFVNSFVNFSGNGKEKDLVSCVNCVTVSLPQYYSFYNCVNIKNSSSSSDQAESNMYFSHCIGVITSNCTYNIVYSYANGTDNTFLGRGLDKVFKTLSGGIPINATPEETFELTEEAKAYLGIDGTEVGMHGGSIPYSPVPSFPIIKKMDVSLKTSSDGKISIDLEISTPE